MLHLIHYNVLPCSYKFGRGNSAEIPGTEPCVVHVYYDHIPQMLRPSRGTARTKWVFLSSFATTKDEARDAYLKGTTKVIFPWRNF